MESENRDDQHAAAAQQTSTSSGNYAFFNHSSLTLPNNLPPDMDDKLLARHKRKRTSPEDQAILEAAYTRDPKPDKNARLELVKQVALGEKEVQIWFQNRRQTSRRKSRPLLPHEIVQYQLSRSGSYPGSVPPQFFSEEDQSERVPSMETFEANEVSAAEHEIREPPKEHVLGATAGFQQNELPSSSLTTNSQTSTRTNSSTTQPVTTSQFIFLPTSHVKAAATIPLVDLSGPNAYLTGRRSLPSLRISQSADVGKPRELADAGARLPLKKSSSIVRLSLSSEGKAQITTTDGSSPSPPRPSQVIHTPQSGNPNSLPIASASHHEQNPPLFKPIQRSSSGRSRDSRAWEFWCDKDARGELEDKAEKDASGSAADAIDLLRSTSGRKVLGPLPMKRNSFLSRQSYSSKRSKLDDKTSTLQRSSTSLGRLQSRPLDDAHTSLKPIENSTYSSMYISSNDSDKENWSPKSLDQSRDAGSESSSITDQQSPEVVSASNQRSHSDVYASKARNPLSTRENDDTEADSEVAAFMRGGGSSRNISKAEELDCVQNLLSLSQGNWR